MITITPYLSFLDQGQEALKFYEQAIEAKVISVRTFGELPGQEIPDEAKNRILHAHLKVGETDLMISDSFPNQPAPQSGDQITLALVKPSAGWRRSGAATSRNIFQSRLWPSER
jgi:PhnB protein